MSSKLKKQELEDFRKNGYIGPFTLYTPEEMKAKLQELRRQLLDTSKAVYSDNLKQVGATNLVNYDRHLDINFLFQHINKAEIVDRLASILGKDIVCWRTEFFAKYPGDEGTDWHQVKSFSAVSKSKKPNIEWPENSDFSGALTVWTAFTDSTVANGCLRFVPGTHGVMHYDEAKDMHYDSATINKKVKNGQKQGFFGYDFSDLQVDPSWQPDESKAVALEMKAGQFIIFWSTLLHASYPHLGKTQDMRLGFSARYVPSYVKIYPGVTEIEEFGSKVSLDKYKPIVVSGQ